MIVIKFSHLCYFADFSVIKKHITHKIFYFVVMSCICQDGTPWRRGGDKLKDWESHIKYITNKGILYSTLLNIL